ncbi:MAG: hypothetical protein C1943_03880 [Halochromatium sp.]|nr:hypothetical protein [Halochromatium sp.]
MTSPPSSKPRSIPASWIIAKDGKAITETWNPATAAKINASGTGYRAVPVIEWLHGLSEQRDQTGSP